MDAFEYALGLFSLLIGLALADIASKIQKLVRHHGTVRLDWLAVLAAAYAMFLAIGLWFSLWAVRGYGETRSYFFYLTTFFELFALYIAAALSLPDDPGPECDLRLFYEENRRRFWTAVFIFQCFYVGHGAYYWWGMAPTILLTAVLLKVIPALILPLVLGSFSSRRVQYSGIGLLLALNWWSHIGDRLA